MGASSLSLPLSSALHMVASLTFNKKTKKDLFSAPNYSCPNEFRPVAETVSRINCSGKCELQPCSLPRELQPAAGHASSNLQPPTSTSTCSCSRDFPHELQPWSLPRELQLQLLTWASTCICSRELQPAAAHVSSNLHLPTWALTYSCLRDL